MIATNGGAKCLMKTEWTSSVCIYFLEIRVIPPQHEGISCDTNGGKLCAELRMGLLGLI